ncbi:MAG: hypothetical protein EOO01_12605 [Chitinophagaceae bacterium]|nr:MAG: hypothetical protein EOO01_12605 [Chitinophagaceae bacterium]
MKKRNPGVDQYFIDGCGRCPLGGTPACKVHNWENELQKLREIVLECGLIEELKWGVPCYTLHGANVVIISALKECCVISFFKGALLGNEEGILVKPGENSQAGRIIRFTSLQNIKEMEPRLKAYVYEAMEVENAGLKVELKKNPEPIPEEFQQKLDNDPALNTAFYALTPGRQRGYIIHFSSTKQSKTRESRIEKCLPLIFSGIGLHDKYS